MRGAILYMGKYGSTAQYASWLAEATGFDLVNLYDGPEADIHGYAQLVMGSSVHCGWLRIAGWLRHHEDMLCRQRAVLFSVSGLQPESPLLRTMIQANLGPRLWEQLAWFALPGRLIHSELEPVDRLLLKCEASLGLRLGAHSGQYLSPSGDFNFVCRRQLEPLLQHLRAQCGLEAHEL